MFTANVTWDIYKQLSLPGDVVDVRIPYVMGRRLVDGKLAGGRGRRVLSEAHIKDLLPAPLQIKVRSHNDGLLSPWLSLEEALQWCLEVIDNL